MPKAQKVYLLGHLYHRPRQQNLPTWYDLDILLEGETITLLGDGGRATYWHNGPKALEITEGELAQYKRMCRMSRFAGHFYSAPIVIDE